MADRGDNPNIKQETQSNSYAESGKITPTQQNISPYVLNRDKAVKKIIDAAKREEHADFQFHSNRLMIHLSAAAYGTMCKAIEKYYENSQFEVTLKEKMDQKEIITERLLSIKNPENLKESLRISMYHTTSRILVNGPMYPKFVAQHLDQIRQSLPDSNEMVELNNDIISTCAEFLKDLKIQRKSDSNSTPLKAPEISEKMIPETQDGNLKIPGACETPEKIPFTATPTKKKEASTPKSYSNVTPKSDSNVTPKSDSNVKPKSNSNVTPKPDSNVTPKSDSNVTPKSDSNVTPKSDSNVTPKSDSNVTPNSDSNVKPKPDRNVTLKSDSNVTPKFKTITPVPEMTDTGGISIEEVSSKVEILNTPNNKSNDTEISIESKRSGTPNTTPSAKVSPRCGRGSMQEEHAMTIQSNYTFLTQELTPSPLADYLYQEFIFDHETHERITTNKDGRRAGMRILLKALLNSGKRAFPKFVEGLRYTGYNHVADVLTDTESD